MILQSWPVITLRPWEVESLSTGNPAPHFYGTRRFITISTGAYHWTLSLCR